MTEKHDFDVGIYGRGVTRMLHFVFHLQFVSLTHSRGGAPLVKRVDIVQEALLSTRVKRSKISNNCFRAPKREQAIAKSDRRASGRSAIEAEEAVARVWTALSELLSSLSRKESTRFFKILAEIAVRLISTSQASPDTTSECLRSTGAAVCLAACDAARPARKLSGPACCANTRPGAPL